MVMHSSLFLHEEILLLALHDDEGTVGAGTTYSFAVGGALLAELVVRRRIEIVGTGSKRYVQLLDATPVGEALLDESLSRIAAARRRGTLATWVTRFAGSPQMRHRLADGLCRRGILRSEEKEVLLFFKRRVYPALDPEPEQEVVRRLNEAIFTDADVDARTIVLLSLANSAQLLPMVFDKKALKTVRGRIDALVAREKLGSAVKGAIEAADVAMMIAVMG